MYAKHLMVMHECIIRPNGSIGAENYINNFEVLSQCMARTEPLMDVNPWGYFL